MKIQTRTALLFTGLTAGLLFLLTVGVYFFATRFTYQDFRKRLELRAILAAKVTLEKDETSIEVFREIQQRHIERLPNQKEFFIKTDSLKPINETGTSLRLPLSFYQAVLKDGKAYYDHFPTSYAGIYYPDNQGNFIVIASAENEYGIEALRNLRTTFLISLVVGMGIVFTVGVFFSRKTFEPVRRIVAKTKSITAQNLHLRLATGPSKDEIDELAHTVNGMLDRLETAFETQNNFVSHASHELSTPLTTVIGEAELALIKQRSPQEYQEALHIILGEADRLRQLTTGLLSLAQSSFGKHRYDNERIPADDLLMEVKAAVERIEASCRLQIHLENLPDDADRLQLLGNRQMVLQALSNIVMNGCKYSGNQPVQVHLSFPPGAIQITVVDKGIGIPAKDLPHIFSPFFRASNTGSYKGHGIGLPLTATILRQHNATIDVQSAEGQGTQVSVTFPVANAY